MEKKTERILIVGGVAGGASCAARLRRNCEDCEIHIFDRGPQIRDAILGNAGTLVTFRVGYTDAEILGQEFYPEFSPADLTRLPNFHIYLKLMVSGTPSSAFSAETTPPGR